MTEVKISVRNLIEFVLRNGDISSKSAASSPARLEEGTRAHIAHQKMRLEEDSSYIKEYYLKHTREIDGCLFTVDGRADGLVHDKYIEEIKSTYVPLDDIEDGSLLHWAQVMFYGFMYLEDKKGEEINLKLTYCNLDDNIHKTFERLCTIDELRSFVEKVITGYMRFIRERLRWQELRDASLKVLDFPFERYREGQRELAVAVYGTIKEGRKLFAQAPTGTGKTVSTLFPSLKALGEGLLDRIFYLTSKGTGKTVAEETVDVLKVKGARIRTLTLTGKEKACLNETVECEPEKCPYAKGHLDRINECLLEMLQNEETFTREKLEEYAIKHMVCPFEMSLDMSLFSDLIICDYNYVFDPRVYLRRFFVDIREKYMFLVDEAHNLVDRSREMYSSTLLKSEVMEAKKAAKGKSRKLEKSLGDLNKIFIAERKELEVIGGRRTSNSVPEELLQYAEKFITAFEGFQKDHPEEFEEKEKILDLFFKAHNFVAAGAMFREGYIAYTESSPNDVRFRIFCMDPGEILSEIFKRARSAVIFSATLTPMKYYMDVLGGEEGDYRMALKSPFPKENLEVFLDRRIDTRFSARENSFEGIADNIQAMAMMKKGNYMAFFPSYKYMNNVYEVFLGKYGTITDTFLQTPSMEDQERETVLDSFRSQRGNSYIAFMVLGGVFAEGIDLKGEALIGAAVVGVGYPQVSFERDLIRDYFEKEGLGYEYAYIYPGMNRVLQAGGRVIRTEEDKGTILLMDLRYSWSSFKSLLPEHWLPLLEWKRKNHL